jgi:TetR/AcrR family transcriptional regulator, regulator of biofilm formation and stress response
VGYVSHDKRAEQLIDATLRVIHRNGLAGATTRAIAAEANAPLASIHYTFGTIDELVVAAFSRLIDDVEARLRSGLDLSIGFAQCLQQVFSQVADLLDDPFFGPLIGDLNPSADPRLKPLEHRYYELGTRLVTDISDANELLPAESLAQLARLMIAAIDGIFLQYESDPDRTRARNDLDAFAIMLGHLASTAIATRKRRR